VPKELDKQDMEDFFTHLVDLEAHFTYWTGNKPKKLVISSEILRKLSKVTGFYQRPELRSEVTAYSPVVRYFTLKNCVVTLQEDYEEPFMHLE
jgi:uncharacterized protein YihD (DUF1040 family)